MTSVTFDLLFILSYDISLSCDIYTYVSICVNRIIDIRDHKLILNQINVDLS